MCRVDLTLHKSGSGAGRGDLQGFHLKCRPHRELSAISNHIFFLRLWILVHCDSNERNGSQ